MKYKYVALNRSQQTLSGVIEGANEEAARAKLNELGLSVLNLQQFAGGPTEVTDITRYHFHATDNDQKKVIGTIAATNKLKALDRLVNEYQLNVIKLYAASASETEQEQSRQEVQQLYQELNQIKAQQKINKEQAKAHQQERYQEQIKTEVDKIITSIQEFLTKYDKELKPTEKDYLQGQLAHLQKVKFSENLTNVERSSKKLLKYMQEKELFIEEGNNLSAQADVQLSTKKLLSELRDISKDNQAAVQNLKSQQSTWQQIKDFFFDKTPKVELPAPITAQQQELKQTQKEIWTYIKLIISTKKSHYRNQAIKVLKGLFRKWWRLHQQLQQAIDEHERKAATSKDQQGLLQVSNITAALMGFYLLFYFIAHFLTIKSTTIAWPNYLQVHSTRSLIYIIIAMFLAHLTIKLKMWLAHKQLPFSNLSFAAGGLVMFLILINL